MADLYEICSLCGGTGVIPPDHTGYARPCYCKPLRVVAVGVTTGQLERLVEADRARRGDPAVQSKERVGKGGE